MRIVRVSVIKEPASSRSRTIRGGGAVSSGASLSRREKVLYWEVADLHYGFRVAFNDAEMPFPQRKKV